MLKHCFSRISVVLSSSDDQMLPIPEYIAFLQSIGEWGTGDYTHATFDIQWPKECDGMGCSPDGITWCESNLKGECMMLSHFLTQENVVQGGV
jgi:hypothetical protein